MPHLAEQAVQMTALNFLTRRYRGFIFPKKIFAQPEVKTKKEFGGKRADGLIAFRHWFWGEYVVSIEAKSIKTKDSITPRFNVNKLLRNSIWTGLLFCAGTGALLPIYRMADGYWQLLIPFNSLIISSLIYGYLTIESGKHKVVKVIEQLRQYPANEQWLAFSKDSVNVLPKEYQRTLREICRTQGVGVVLVENNRTKIWVKPKLRINWWGRSFLSYYSIENDIKKCIE
ncbi:MAG: hypothetical protein KA974_09165 [Saprospiraceae bacterium]|nr:hypothetical protein [Saprospiraceae bacterium]MBP7699253.1 hypothetical protein [Saprospiraceae bacterium]